MIETARLHIRQLVEDDADGIMALLNDADFLRNIGDRGVRSREDAQRYIRNGPMLSYQTQGYGLNHVADRDAGAFIGICGLLKRDWLPDPDIGFAFLPAHRSRGLAAEAAAAVLAHGRATLGVGRVLAITAMENPASIRLLEKLGFEAQGLIQSPDHASTSRLFALDAA